MLCTGGLGGGAKGGLGEGGAEGLGGEALDKEGGDDGEGRGGTGDVDAREDAVGEETVDGIVGLGGVREGEAGLPANRRRRRVASHLGICI